MAGLEAHCCAAPKFVCKFACPIIAIIAFIRACAFSAVGPIEAVVDVGGMRGCGVGAGGGSEAVAAEEDVVAKALLEACVAHIAPTGFGKSFTSDAVMKSTSKPFPHHVALSVASLKD